LAISGISFVVVGTRYRNKIEVTAQGTLDQTILKIWPTVSPCITWPPGLILDEGLIDVLMRPPGGLRINISPI